MSNRMGRKNPLPSSGSVIIIMGLAVLIDFGAFLLDPDNNMGPPKEEQGTNQ